MENKKEQIKDLAPLYVKGELSDEQRILFEQHLEHDEELQIEVAEFTAIQASYSDLSSTLPEPPPDMFSKIMKKIESEKTTPKSRKVPVKKPGIMERIRGFFTMPGPAWALAAVQFAAIVILIYHGQGENGFKTLSGGDAGAVQGVRLNVVFSDTVMQSDIKQLLNKLNVTIVDGPTENGLYVLMVRDKSKKSEVMKNLEMSPAVKFVQIRY
jgi:anti-sigma factor RsiW